MRSRAIEELSLALTDNRGHPPRRPPGRIDRDQLLEMADRLPPRAGVAVRGPPERGGDPGTMDAVRDGRAAVQDEGSQLVAVAPRTHRRALTAGGWTCARDQAQGGIARRAAPRERG